MKTCAIPNGGGFMAQHRHIGAQVFTQTHTHTHTRALADICAHSMWRQRLPHGMVALAARLLIVVVCAHIYTCTL